MGRQDEHDDDNREASAEEISTMANLTAQALEAGAMTFSSNRIPLHTSIHGDPVPGTFASYEELAAILRASNRNGEGLFQVAPAGSMGEDPDAPLREFKLFERLSKDTGCRITFGLGQITGNGKLWVDMLDRLEKANASGARLTPWVASRPVCVMFSTQGFTPFEDCPTYRELKSLPVMKRVAAMATEEVRGKILSEQPADHVLSLLIGMNLGNTYPMVYEPIYEPQPEDSLAAEVRHLGNEDSGAIANFYDKLVTIGQQSQGKGFLSVYLSGLQMPCRTVHGFTPNLC
jgi:N-acyl-D-aspartate/D-glutamate deacylase